MHSILIPPKLEQGCGYLWGAQGGPGQVLEVSHSARLLCLNERRGGGGGGGGKKEQQKQRMMNS